MIGRINITGVINHQSLIDVITQVTALGEGVTAYEVFIDSPGGSVTQGFEIFSYLQDLSKSKPLKTIVDGQCGSIATIICMASDVRLITPNSQYLIHLPYGDDIRGTADDLEEIGNQIRQAENEMIAVYSKITGISKAGIASIMKQDNPMSAETAISLKLLTGIYTGQSNTLVPTEKFKALALFKDDNNNTKLNTLEMSIFKKLEDLLRGKMLVEVKAFDFTSADGKVLSITHTDPSASDDGKILVGDLITIGDEPGQGEYMLQDTSKVIAENGVVTEFTPASTASTEEEPVKEETAVEANSEVATLKAKIEELEKSLLESKADSEKVLALVSEKLKSVTGKPLEIQGKATVFTKTEVVVEKTLNEKIAEKIEARKNKIK